MGSLDFRAVADTKKIDRERRVRLRKWLAYYRHRRGWTNTRLAQELGLSEPTITNILNGATTPGLDVFIRMHDRLRRSADDLLDIDPPEVVTDD